MIQKPTLSQAPPYFVRTSLHDLFMCKFLQLTFMWCEAFYIHFRWPHFWRKRVIHVHTILGMSRPFTPFDRALVMLKYAHIQFWSNLLEFMEYNISSSPFLEFCKISTIFNNLYFGNSCYSPELFHNINPSIDKIRSFIANTVFAVF